MTTTDNLKEKEATSKSFVLFILKNKRLYKWYLQMQNVQRNCKIWTIFNEKNFMYG